MITSLYNSLTKESPSSLTFSELSSENSMSRSRLCEVMNELEDSGYIKKIDENKYILWKWGVLLVEAESMKALGVLEFMYALEVE